MLAKMRLFLTANIAASILVAEEDPRAATLFAAVGDEIPASAVEKFGLVDGGLPKGRAPKAAETLLGSSLLPSLVEIRPGVAVQLGAIVLRTQKSSGLDVDAWNGQPDAEREQRLADTVEAMKQEAATKAAKPKPAARTPAAGKKKAAADKGTPAPENKETPAPANKVDAAGSGAAA